MLLSAWAAFLRATSGVCSCLQPCRATPLHEDISLSDIDLSSEVCRWQLRRTLQYLARFSVSPQFKWSLNAEADLQV